MHVATVFLDRVFDVQPDQFYGDLARTRFSFESDGQCHLSVLVYGQPQLAAGQTITGILAEPGNWQTLMGLRVHESGQICMPGMANHVLSLATVTVFGLCLSSQMPPDIRNSMMPLLGVAYVILAGLLIRDVWKIWRLRQTLQAAT